MYNPLLSESDNEEESTNPNTPIGAPQKEGQGTYGIPHPSTPSPSPSPPHTPTPTPPPPPPPPPSFFNMANTMKMLVFKG